MKKLIYLSLLIISLISCQNNYKTLHKDGFSIRVPKDMSDKKGQMMDSALLEYADLEQNLFLVVERAYYPSNNLDSARAELIDSNLMPDTLDNESYTIIRTNKGQLVEAKTLSYTPWTDITSTYWVVGIFPAAKHNFYIVWTWTDLSNKERNSTIMKKIVKSFKIRD